MSIRIYLCKWRVEDVAGKKHVVNDIAEQAENQTGLEWVSMHYSPADENGIPTKDVCLVFVKSQAFDYIDSIEGIVKLPVGNLSEVPTLSEKNQVVDELDVEFKIPTSTFSNVQTRKDIVNKIMKHIHPAYVTYSRSGHIKDKDFA